MFTLVVGDANVLAEVGGTGLLLLPIESAATAGGGGGVDAVVVVLGDWIGLKEPSASSRAPEGAKVGGSITDPLRSFPLKAVLSNLPLLLDDKLVLFVSEGASSGGLKGDARGGLPPEGEGPAALPLPPSEPDSFLSPMAAL